MLGEKTFKAIHKLMRTKVFGLTAAIALLTISVSAKPANAGTLYQGWNYGIDAFGDGSGGSQYDIKGMAIKETSDSIWVALTGGTPLTGNSQSQVLGGSIGWGDLFFNFSGKDFQTAHNAGDLFGVRFAATNDAKVGLGVYQNAKAINVATQNNGYGTLEQYYNSGYNKTNTLGTDITTKSAAYAYLSKGSVGNVIGSGNKVAEVDILSLAQLQSAGLNFNHFSASSSQTIGFKFNKSSVKSGSYTASLFLECLNDGVAVKGDLHSVPEPTALSGLGVVMGGMLLSNRRKLRKVLPG